MMKHLAQELSVPCVGWLSQYETHSLAPPTPAPVPTPCRPARASQEFVGMFLALLMLGVEVMDYVNWARECYHRRLTMVVPQEQDPPLYPIPGRF